MYIYMDLDVYTQILMYISLSCHVNGDLAVLSLFNKHTSASHDKTSWMRTYGSLNFCHCMRMTKGPECVTILSEIIILEK